MRRVIATAFLFFISLGMTLTANAQHYKVSGQIPLGGEGGWDYLYADSPNRTLYVTHGTEVEIVDLDSDKPVGKITGLKGIHGVAVAGDLNRGFISDGKDNTVVVFDLKSHAVLQKVKAGTNPDGILYDPASKRVFAFNGRSNDATAIDAASGNVAGTLPLGGKPEFPVTDGSGNMFVNIEDKNEIVQFDPKELKVKNRWKVSPCEGPSGLAWDDANRKLFAVCDEKKMVVVDAGSGKVTATVPIGDGPDATAFDSANKLAFSSNGQDGTLTVVKQESPDKYSVVENVPTEKSARTMALDSKTHKIYLSAAELGPRPEPTADNPHPRPAIKSGSFHLIVVSPE
jgi:DNA-binding beta-propeller fold protein YncE